MISSMLWVYSLSDARPRRSIELFRRSLDASLYQGSLDFVLTLSFLLFVHPRYFGWIISGLYSGSIRLILGYYIATSTCI
ncbi:hypothetical protein FA15DRAFT_366339 [Coprinopsis marcescibilis]|uniref:Uncharacterized protein n=1 Tax=Coprinopsis marcescibilis TaxID=230819 RepID=A0A5C3KA99_COPMA|nr:hypothetical protein FA15DRAFT_366339 [Coprinopsis marcescibilis]